MHDQPGTTVTVPGFSRALEKDLKSLTKGGCFFDAATLEQFSSDESWYKINPIAVLQPRDASEVAAVTHYCYERELPLIPRGGATGLAGQAIGMGIILDFTRHMNSVKDSTDSTVTAEPGVVLRTLNEVLAGAGKYFPVDPASVSRCTLGGMIGTNAAGAHGVLHGAMKDHVQELTVILSNGESARVSQPQHTDGLRNPFLRQITDTLTPLLLKNRDVIARHFPDVRKNSSGYNLKDAVAADDLDLLKLIVGSEGTLATVVQAVLHIESVPPHRLGAIAYLSSYEQAMDATILALDYEPAAIEILDQTYVGLVRGLSPETDELIMEGAKVMLYFEFEGSSEDELRGSIVRLAGALSSVLPLRFLPLTHEEELRRLWKLREEASRVINTHTSSGKTSFVEDVAVPVRELPRYIKGLKSILEHHHIEFCLYGHAGSGNIHCATFVDLADLRHYRIIDTLASDIYELAISLGGTLSGEHGDGLVRTPFLERLYGPQVFNLFRTVKATFDPRNILNPGKIIGDQNTTILHDLDLS